MKFLFTTIPGSGHFHPMVPTASALQARGHEVAFAASASYCPKIERTGFTAFPAGADWLENFSDPVMRDHVAEGARVHPWAGFVEISGLGMAADVTRLADEWLPDLIIREPMEFGGLIAGEARGIPIAVHSISSRMPRPLWKMFVGEALEALRTEHGVAPDPDMARMVCDSSVWRIWGSACGCRVDAL